MMLCAVYMVDTRYDSMTGSRDVNASRLCQESHTGTEDREEEAGLNNERSGAALSNRGSGRGGRLGGGRAGRADGVTSGSGGLGVVAGGVVVVASGWVDGGGSRVVDGVVSGAQRGGCGGLVTGASADGGVALGDGDCLVQGGGGGGGLIDRDGLVRRGEGEASGQGDEEALELHFDMWVWIICLLGISWI